MSEDSYPICPWCHKRLREVWSYDGWGGFRYCPEHGVIPRRSVQEYRTWADNKTTQPEVKP